MNKILAAHIKDDRIQSVIQHLRATAALAEIFGERFGNGENAFVCGLIHDIGKYSEKFQRRIYQESNQRVDHSTAGALELSRQFQDIGYLLAYCTAGHHTGLPDEGSLASTSDDLTLSGRLKRRLEPYARFADEVTLQKKQLSLPIFPLGKKGFSVAFYIRILFSCLVDADFLDTERFMSGKERRSLHEEIEMLNNKMKERIRSFSDPNHAINEKRTQILHSCIEKSEWDRGLYTLTVPTGGGKTIASMAFALDHARRHGMDRVIYVIPYNSIIEQNAAVFKEILGENNVLEHHSSFAYDDADESLMTQRLATENWDMPVVVTTTVQFFESLFANRTSKCRKLHSIANSVIIFDEAQLLPTKYLLPCVRAISELVYNYKSTCVLCSATQPALDKLFPQEIKCSELCDDTQEHFRFFKRTQLIHIGELNDARLARRLSAVKQVLCIVSTRKQAQKLFYLLKTEGAYHLSTLMYPLHRRAVLKEIRTKLDKGQPCRVVSTSLVEAGVDVDFPVVYRAEAGLDSLIQAAGRCNREGKNPVSPVYVFKPESDYRKSLPAMLKRPVKVTDSIMSRFEDITTPEAINAYFSELYMTEGAGLDAKHIVERFEEGYGQDLSFPFAQIAGEFKLIENTTRAIIIPKTADACLLVQRLRDGERSRSLLRSIQQYTVNAYDGNYNALYGAGSIEPLDSEIAVLTDLNKYDDKTGLDANTDSGQAVFT